MRQYEGIYEAVRLEGWGTMRLAGASGGLGKTPLVSLRDGKAWTPNIAVKGGNNDISRTCGCQNQNLLTVYSVIILFG